MSIGDDASCKRSKNRFFAGPPPFWANPGLALILGALGIIIIPSARQEWFELTGLVSAMLLIAGGLILCCWIIRLFLKDLRDG